MDKNPGDPSRTQCWSAQGKQSDGERLSPPPSRPVPTAHLVASGSPQFPHLALRSVFKSAGLPCTAGHLQAPAEGHWEMLGEGSHLVRGSGNRAVGVGLSLEGSVPFGQCLALSSLLLGLGLHGKAAGCPLHVSLPAKGSNWKRGLPQPFLPHPASFNSRPQPRLPMPSLLPFPWSIFLSSYFPPSSPLLLRAPSLPLVGPPPLFASLALTLFGAFAEAVGVCLLGGG